MEDKTRQDKASKCLKEEENPFGLKVLFCLMYVFCKCFNAIDQNLTVFENNTDLYPKFWFIPETVPA